jgi:serine/threonine-protein kinase
MTDPIRDQIQTALGPSMTLGRELGGGGMSRVFLARDATLGREVVVKVLSPELAQELSTERFGREIALAAALQHANIVPVLSAGVTADGLPFYLMPFIQGASLRDLVGDGKTLPISDVLLVLNDASRALSYAHGRGVVHRDIKPDNIMLSGGAALVTDFGIAKAMSSSRTDATSATDSLTRMGTSLGTPAYMAPEQGAGDPDTDHRADIYALGAMAYELLTGQPPFGVRAPHAQLVAHLSETPVPVAQRRPDVPEPLARLVMWCLEKDPANRPQQASDLQELLADAALASRMGSTAELHAAASSAPAAAAVAAPARVRGMGGRVVALVALIAAVAAGGVWYARRPAAVSSGPDKTLVAVMPFTVRDASLDVWREGMVDILARSLDGAGPLRTVSPSTSIAKATGRGDVTSAVSLGTSVGAGLVVFGELSPMGKDSVRARVALVDVSSNKVQHNIDVTGDVTRIDALADSVSLQLLRALGGDGLAGGARIASLGTSSLTALKAYLVGQQYYRRGLIDSTLMAFESAVAADSLFSLAWRGVASVYIRTGREAMPEARAALDRAIRLRRAGSPRDSLLFHGDSLRLALGRRTPAANDPISDIPEVSALLATLSEATRRYPSDAELWMELGDAGFHYGYLVNRPDTVVLQEFARAIALDSMMLVPFVHAQALAIRLAKYRDAATYLRHLARLSGEQARLFYSMFAVVLDSAPSLSPTARTQLDTVALPYVGAILRELASVPEATPLSLAILEAQRSRKPAPPGAPDAALYDRVVALQQAQLGKTVTTPQALTLADRVQLAIAGMLPVEPVLTEAAPYLARQPLALSSMMSLYASARDTGAVRVIAKVLDSVDVAVRAQGNTAGAHRGDVARAYLQLAQGDSAAALRTLLTVPMATCGDVPCAAGTTARLLVKAGRVADAARVLDRAWSTTRTGPTAAPLMLLRGEVAERLNDHATARTWFSRVIAQWGRGDAAARATVTAAQEGMRRVP